MKKTSFKLAGTIMFLSAFVACTDESATISSGELKEIVVNADHFVSETDSRAFYLSGNSVEFKWSDGDTIGIFPNEGAQAYFPILTTDDASSSASFTGGGWALKPSSTYAAYYPFIGKFYINKNEVPISYVGQKQTDNSSMGHLSAYDFMAASASTPQSGLVNFQMKHLGSFVQLKITMPQGGTLSSVTLSADEALFVTKGTMDVMATASTIKAVETSKTLTLDVENVTTTVESPVATLYMMLAPVDFTGKTLSAIVKTSDGQSETIALTCKNFEAGKAYGVSGSMKDPNGGVTAGDGTYANGVVSVDVAGNMKNLLGSDYLNITELKVVGPINGFDIYYLRKMLGSSHFSEVDWGKLTTLDLSEATIVEGDWYWDPSSYSGNEYYSSNNVIGDYMFYNCANLKNIELPVNITSIGEYAFENCDLLTSIKIPAGVTTIDEHAFYDCDALTNVSIGDGVASIGSYAFYDCDVLAGVAIPSGTIGFYAFYDCDALTNVSIGDGVTSIGSYAFRTCNALAEVAILSGTIGSYAFCGCEALTNVSIGDGVTTIDEHAFYACVALTNVSIGDGVTSIGYSAFHTCHALTNVNITDLSSWCKISFDDGFSNPLLYGAKLYLNNNLVTELTIPDDIAGIKNYTFYGCGSIIKVIIPDHVTSIGSSALYGCEALTNVSIGNSVTSISSNAFSYCSITECYCYAPTPPTLGDSAFYDGVESDAILYIPVRGGGSVYKSSVWGDYFTNIIEMD